MNDMADEKKKKKKKRSLQESVTNLKSAEKFDNSQERINHQGQSVAIAGDSPDEINPMQGFKYYNAEQPVPNSEVVERQPEPEPVTMRSAPTVTAQPQLAPVTPMQEAAVKEQPFQHQGLVDNVFAAQDTYNKKLKPKDYDKWLGARDLTVEGERIGMSKHSLGMAQDTSGYDDSQPFSYETIGHHGLMRQNVGYDDRPETEFIRPWGGAGYKPAEE
ncbi:hypothetical protein DRH14_05605, partial [Candidatus Shapirobacteria bacterium]